MKVSRKFNDTHLRYRASKMITIPYSISEKSLKFIGKHIRKAFNMKVSRKFNDTSLRYRASDMITVPYIMLIGAHFKSAVGGVRQSGS